MKDSWAITVLTECAVYLIQWVVCFFLIGVTFLLLKYLWRPQGHTEHALSPVSMGKEGGGQAWLGSSICIQHLSDALGLASLLWSTAVAPGFKRWSRSC